MNKKFPVLFVGHGSPMNAITKNEFAQQWKVYAERIGKPKGIIAISAHWYTQGFNINDQPKPKTIYDMYGFPQALYEITYEASSSSTVAQQLVQKSNHLLQINNSFGYDHGLWSVLIHMYPQPDFPVIPISVSRSHSLEEHFALGKLLAELRAENYLLFASGNVVHNLRRADFNKADGFADAKIFDDYIYDSIVNRDFSKVINFKNAPPSSYALAFETLEHYLPLVVALGATEEEDQVEVFNRRVINGALSMTSYYFH